MKNQLELFLIELKNNVIALIIYLIFLWGIFSSYLVNHIISIMKIQGDAQVILDELQMFIPLFLVFIFFIFMHHRMDAGSQELFRSMSSKTGLIYMFYIFVFIQIVLMLIYGIILFLLGTSIFLSFMKILLLIELFLTALFYFLNVVGHNLLLSLVGIIIYVFVFTQAYPYPMWFNIFKMNTYIVEESLMEYVIQLCISILFIIISFYIEKREAGNFIAKQ